MKVRGILLSLSLLACAGVAPELERAREALDAGRLAEAGALLDPLRGPFGDHVGVRLQLGELHYRRARRALELGREGVYRRELGRAQGEIVESMALDPESSDAHAWLGVLAVYQRDLDQAITSMRNARVLAPGRASLHTNLAELSVYRGELDAAARHLARARRLGASAAEVELVEVLLAWRRGDYAEAVERFEGVRAETPDLLQRWNEAPIADPIDEFSDLARFCCSHEGCGPFMASSCRELEWAVPARDVSEDTLREERRLGHERRRRLIEIYGGPDALGAELGVEIEEPA